MGNTFGEQECPVCGKKFIIRDHSEWVYKLEAKDSKKYYCSWSCMRKDEKRAKRHGTEKP